MERKASWERLRAEPWLPDSQVRPVGGGMSRVQIIHSPSFNPSSFWEVCQLGERWLLYTAKVVAARFPGPLKVQGYNPVEFPPEQLADYFRRLVALNIPIAPELRNIAGLDGCFTQLTLFGGLSSRVQFEWWSDPPPGWTPLTTLTDEILVAFSKGLSSISNNDG